MHRRRFLTLALIAAAPLARPMRAAAAGGTIAIFAAAALRDAFEEDAYRFTKKTGIDVRLTFGDSDALATQIVQGAAVDVFVSAGTAPMKRLTTTGLTIDEPARLAQRRVAVNGSLLDTIAAKADPALATDVPYLIAGLKGAANPGGAETFIAFMLADGQKALLARGFSAS
jgi:ABC-type molybdate transport system substrate-binding protein